MPVWLIALLVSVAGSFVGSFAALLFINYLAWHRSGE